MCHRRPKGFLKFKKTCMAVSDERREMPAKLPVLSKAYPEKSRQRTWPL
jgi:hypothetical protein